MSDDLDVMDRLCLQYVVMKDARESIDWEDEQNQVSIAFELLSQWEGRVKSVIGEDEEDIRERVDEIVSDKCTTLNDGDDVE